MQEACLVDAVRTPFGKRNGSFRDTHPQDLVAEPLLTLEERNGFSGPDDIEDVVYGCVDPVDEQANNIARLAPMVAGWGDDVPGVQLDRMCGSGQQAINFAAGQIRAGFQDLVVAGGVEHMTRVPIGSAGSSITDTYFEHFDELRTQGEGAERIAENGDFSREYLDDIAVASQQRWGEAAESGKYDDQVVPADVTLDGESAVVREDEHPRPETDAETLAGLPLAFREEGNGVIHAGNASGIVDGAAATLVASGKGLRGTRMGADGPDRRYPSRRRRSGDDASRADPGDEGVARAKRDDRFRHRSLRGERGLRPGGRRMAGRDWCRLGADERLGRRDRPRPPPRRDRRGAARETPLPVGRS